MQAYFRNKRNGEFKLVEVDSPEMEELRADTGLDGMSLWEQTSAPHAQAVKERATYGELADEDLGHDDQDAIRDATVRLGQEVGPDPTPWRNLTPGEIEAGLTPDQKEEDMRDQLDEENLNRLHSTFNDAADRIADERKEREPAAQAAGLRARAGGSDERDNVPVSDANKQEPSPAKTSGGGSKPGNGGGGSSESGG